MLASFGLEEIRVIVDSYGWAGQAFPLTHERRKTSMTPSIEARLAEAGITLPTAAAPAANYAPYALAGNLLYVSGQLPMDQGAIAVKGKLGEDLSVEDGQKAARLCAINILAQAMAALGDLERIAHCLRLNGFVNATEDFSDHPAVINGASDLIVAALGDKGKHSRIAVGCSGLPFGAAVEVDAVFSVT